jgi:NitT/TauT family transport system ATP-binding protein
LGALKVLIDRVSLKYPNSTGKEEYLLKDFSLEIDEGEFTCLLGPSGCGKSSLLGMVAGFVQGSSGKILVGDKKISRPDLSRTLVFQEYALFPWLNVIENVAFGLKYKMRNKSERLLIASRYLHLVGLLKQARTKVSQLSGGMKQRVALARALAVKPDLLLMDEPFGALDDQSRLIMQSEIVKIWTQYKQGVLFVTHSVDEALLLGDRIVIMGKDENEVSIVKADISIKLDRPRDLSSLELNRARSEIQYALFSKSEKSKSKNFEFFDPGI